MLSAQFSKYYKLLKDSLESVNFTGSELANQSATLAVELLKLEAAVKQSQAEALKEVVQAESMIRSVRDNALISKANAYIGFLNVILNASSLTNNTTTGGKSHSDNVISTINAIDDTYLYGYQATLEELKNDILNLTRADEESEEKLIQHTSLKVTPNYVVLLLGKVQELEISTNAEDFTFSISPSDVVNFTKTTRVLTPLKVGKAILNISAQRFDSFEVSKKVIIEVIAT